MLSLGGQSEGMNVFKKMIGSALFILLVLQLTACQNEKKQAETIYNQLETSARAEKTFADQERQLVKATQEEQTLYNKIIDSDIDRKNEVKDNIDKALKTNSKRVQYLNEAKKSFDQAYQTVETTKERVKKIKNAEQKKEATRIIQLMRKRHQIFDRYYQDYLEALALSKKLYDQLDKKDIKASELDELISKINKKTSGLKQQEDQFNQNTKSYNQAKSHYYQVAQLKTKHT